MSLSQWQSLIVSVKVLVKISHCLCENSHYLSENLSLPQRKSHLSENLASSRWKFHCLSENLSLSQWTSHCLSEHLIVSVKISHCLSENLIVSVNISLSQWTYHCLSENLSLSLWKSHCLSENLSLPQKKSPLSENLSLSQWKSLLNVPNTATTWATSGFTFGRTLLWPCEAAGSLAGPWNHSVGAATVRKEKATPCATRTVISLWSL